MVSYLFITCVLNVAAAEPTTNYVLRLGGGDGRLELPSGAFNDLEEATIEGWVKWSSQNAWGRFFDFGRADRGIYFSRYGDTRTAVLSVPQAGGELRLITAPGLLQSNQWQHLAVVVTRGRASLYFNGVPVLSGSFPGAFNTQRGERNLIGASNYRERFPHDLDTPLEVDEFRVWKGAQTTEQIAQNMFTRLTGNEDGLVGLWSFDDRTARDGTSRALHGKLEGNVSIVPAALPKPGELAPSHLLKGTVAGPDGRPAKDASILVYDGKEVVGASTSDQAGRFEIGVIAQPAQIDISARKGELGDWLMSVRLAPGEVKQHALRLGSHNSISGSLTALDGSPHVAMVIQLVRKGANGGQIEATARSDARGDYRFGTLRPGEYQARCPTFTGFVFANDGQVITLGTRDQIQGINVRLAPFKKGTWENFTVSEGLASDLEIRNVLVEPNGVMWIATMVGVSRYDGESFTTFTTEDGLPDNHIYSIGRQSNGTLWFGTAKGISRWDGKRFQNFTTSDGLPYNQVDGMYVAPDDTIWFACERGGVARYQAGQFTAFNRTNGFPADTTWKIAGSSDGKMVWFAANTGLIRYDGTKFVNVIAEAGLGEIGVDTPSISADGKIWFGSFGRGAWSYDGTNFVNYTTRDGFITDRDVRATHIAPDGSVWFGTIDGISRFNGTNFVNFTKEDGLPENACTSVSSTPDGVMWFGMDRAGSWIKSTALARICSLSSTTSSTSPKSKPAR